jgi:hypothetical protein
MRVAVLLAVALPLAAADLWVKAFATTPAWAYHERSTGWIALCMVLLPSLLLVTRVPSALVPPAAGLLAAGVIGNVMSAAWNDFYVPNPIVVHGERGFLAFNLADIFAVTGILLLFGAIGFWLVRNRALLPSPREALAQVTTAGPRSDREPPA